MNDAQLIRALQSIGKECFVTYFQKFADPSLTNEYLRDMLHQQRGYRPSGCSTRVSRARAIIKAGRAKDALLEVANSFNVDDKIRDLARKLAA